MTTPHAPKTTSRTLMAGAVAISIALGACSSDPVEVESKVVPAIDETSTTVEETTTTSEAPEETTTTAAEETTTTAAGETTTTAADEKAEATTTTAAEDAAKKGDLDGSKFTLKNTAGDEVSATAGSGVEVDSTDGLRYLVDIDAKKITMTWDIENSALDALEGVVAAGDEDVYTFTFEEPILEGVKATADTKAKLVPTVEVTDSKTLVVTIAEGTEIGDGFDAVINLG